jgi:hypothetical protein
MDQVKYVENQLFKYTNELGNNLDTYLNTEYILVPLAILVTAYATLSAMSIPNWLRNLFQNDIFRVLFLSLLLIYRFDNAPHVALAIALIFVLSLHYLSQLEQKEQKEKFEIVNQYRTV